MRHMEIVRFREVSDIAEAIEVILFHTGESSPHSQNTCLKVPKSGHPRKQSPAVPVIMA